MTRYDIWRISDGNFCGYVFADSAAAAVTEYLATGAPDGATASQYAATVQVA